MASGEIGGIKGQVIEHRRPTDRPDRIKSNPKRKRTFGIGELIWQRCAHCGDEVRAPSDIDIVRCGGCVIKQAHNTAKRAREEAAALKAAKRKG